MTDVQRRTVLKGVAAATGVALAAGPFQGFFASASAAPVAADGRFPGYGPLVGKPDMRDGVVRLRLPRGFRYRSFDPTGALLTDGTVIPGRHDGMAAFAGPGSLYTLVRNHEVNGPVGAFGDPSEAYDPLTGGGTTTVEVDGFGNVSRSFVSLNGTQNNCSGGPMPWGSWVTCEETINGDDVGPDFTGQSNEGLRKHGYLFEVPVGGVAAPGTPVRRAGRFSHESVAWDAGTQALYQSEDNFAFPSGFYRYLPPSDPMRVGRLLDGGKLEMLAVTNETNADLAGVYEPAPAVGSRFPVRWVRIPNPDPTFRGTPPNDTALQAVGLQGFAQGAAKFSRLEGTIADRGRIYFTSTQGGTPPPDEPLPSGGYGKGRGQIWAYDTRGKFLELLYESPSKEVLDFPDNVTTSRRGSLVICEDGGEGNFLRGLTTGGILFDFAQNAIAGQENDEFAGSTFSPDFHTLFVNIQSSNGLSFAIWGPWEIGGFR
ncbi:MAG: PhoX family protein [Geodermatophilaceae bacterium]